MNMKLSFWDWRPWAFLIWVMVMPLWIWNGINICSDFRDMSANSIGISMSTPDFANLNAIIWIISFVLSSITAIWLIMKGLNLYINNRCIISDKDYLLSEIPSSTDDEIIELNFRLGISANREEIIIPLKILNSVSIESLAKDISWLLYLHYSGIRDLIRYKRYCALHSLADLFLANWDDTKIKDFVAALTKEKSYMGPDLQSAIRLRRLEIKLVKLKAEIDECYENEAGAVQASLAPSIANKFQNIDELNSGQSAAVKWIKRKAKKWLPKFLFRKSDH